MKRVCHLTTVHAPFDVRIFNKMARGLAAAGYDTHLVAPAESDQTVDGVHIHALTKVRGRIDRMVRSTSECLSRAIAIDADLYHFHDPELIRVGLSLKRHGKLVVYDVHESHAESILDRAYLAPILRRFLSRRVASAESEADRRLDGIVAATPKIARSFANPRTVLVQNFPMLGELEAPGNASFANRERAAVYVGGVSAVRGSHQMVDAIHLVEGARLLLVGGFTPPGHEAELASSAGWSATQRLGWQERPGVAAAMARCRLGLVLFHPLRNHVEAQPNKLFEYMAAGLPVVASDFPHWRGIVEECGCGVLVDPLDVAAIGRAVRGLLDDPALGEAMGQRGRRAVESRFNWVNEELKLLALYDALFETERTAR